MRAASAGIELLALTDHDTVAGVEEAQAAAREAHIRLVPASEISAVHGGREDLHVLGYTLDPADATLAERLQSARQDRERRSEGMAAKLGELGWAVDDAPLARRRVEGKPLGRPHLAAAVLQHPDNAERLREEDLDDVSSFIPAYLIPGAPAYLPRTHPTVPEAIGWIHDAGGVAVWAHPFWDIDDADEVIASLDEFQRQGLDGVEAFYATHGERQTQLLADAAAERGLLTTGSADFHGPDHRMFSDFGAFDLYGREPNLGPIG